jgi:hypothetical protein
MLGHTPRMRLSLRYLALFLALLAIEVFIALRVDDAFVRPYLGDSLVVVLLYCLALAFAPLPKVKLAAWVFVFACCIEFAQALHIVTVLGLQDSKFARVVIGTNYSTLDLVAYAGGVALIWLLEHVLPTDQARASDQATATARAPR